MNGGDPRDRKSSLSTYLWVGLLVLVLAGMFYPLVGVVREGKGTPNCGKNQSQIMGALIAFSTQEEMAGLLPKTLASSKPEMSERRGHVLTIKLMEVLAAAHSLPSGLFKCPVSSTGGPRKDIKPSLARPGSAWAMSQGSGIGYAFDWAAPADPSSQRVVCADRDIKAHKDAVMAVFGDAHVTKLKLVPVAMRAPGSVITEGVIVDPVNFSAGSEPGDDIYSNEGDANDGLTPGQGDPLRAWVK